LRAAAVLASGDFVFIDDFVFEMDGMRGPAQRTARAGASSCFRQADDHFRVSGKPSIRGLDLVERV
jgi:hypothetical protein